MFYHLILPLQEHFTPLNVFRYITLRGAGALATSLCICFLLGPFLIRQLQKRGLTQFVRSDGPEGHLVKKGTPTAGGVMIVLSVFTSVLLWGNLGNMYVWIALGSLVAYGLVGLADDIEKTVRRSSKGLSARVKIALQLAIALAIGVALVAFSDERNMASLQFPLIKHAVTDLGWTYLIVVAVVLVATTNAVNLSDGLDGLAIGVSSMTILTLAALSYVAGHKILANYLHTMFVNGCGEVSVVCMALFGAGLGFFWWNAFPAQVFMGDTGSMAIGGVIGAVALLCKQEFLLPILGGVFVIEAASVIIQVASFKTRGKRVFLMAPFHHHLELKGWHEAKVVSRMLIISFIFSLIAVAVVKVK
ncbi:MAG: phospho-N-acetylmuramoyl-pentapeptide-transferase [Candidatus Coatesbacteria bacterium]|nr:phospho-N-acetylmuramoyl-pentapeptide-transferase [Candidatus Coatesbacteria bacterium]